MSTTKFRLLLHGHDGSVPYLTPELMRLVFCPNDDGTKSSSSADSSPDDDADDDWKWRRQHFILGVAVKDTCVTAVYREALSAKTMKKRKKNGGGAQPGNDAAKRAKTELKSGDSVLDDVSTAQTTGVTSTAASTSKTTTANDEANTKKPAGYTFLTPSKSSQICSGINSHNNIDQQQNKNDASTTSSSDNKNGSKQNNNSSFTSFMQTHLRIPSYISTLIVPTFSLEYPETTSSIDETDENEKKYIPKKVVNNPVANKQKQQKKNNKDGVTVVVIPNSTKDTMPLDTPHGWQKLQPDQYWDAVTSLTTTLTTTCSTSSSSTTAGNVVSQGVVGLFDHMGIPRNVLNYLFAEFAKKHGKEDGEDDNIIQPLAPRAQALVSEKMTEPPTSSNKWNTALQRLVQRTNDWSNRTQSYSKQQQQQSVSMNFWTPVHLAASHLTLDALLACPRVRVAKSTSKGNDDDSLRQQQQQQQQQLEVAVAVPTCSNVAIVGWNSISYNREYRCQALQRLMTTMQQPSSPTTPPLPSQYMILSVNDLPSILDAAKAGVSIIGTDLVRQWSCSGRAICLDLSFEGNDDENDAGNNDVAAGDDTTKGAEMDLKNEQYAQDSLPLLPGCKCIACRPRRKSTSYHSSFASQENSSSIAVPSFTRAYIHHLLKAKEMLAETLLFVHNLHQVLLLLRQLGEAAVLDDGSKVDGAHYLNALCGKIEGHL